MKKIVAIVILLFILLVGWLYYVNLTNIDEFRLNGFSKIPQEKIVVNEPLYVSFDVKYHGNAKPTIKDIRFIKRDGAFLEKDGEDISYIVYIDEKANTLSNTAGVVTEAEAEQFNLLENYTPVENFKVEQQDLNVVIKVMIKNEDYTNNVNAMQIDYELLGKETMKQMLFTGFIEE